LTNPLPIEQKERIVVVDVLRGFALFGVLLGNFSSMLTNNVPQSIIDAHATGIDTFLNKLHDIFIENKFMCLFSILFGYGFGVIMERLKKKNINPTPFFLRRMLWLFVFGCVNLAFWNGDILHIYALTGVFLLFFKKQSNRSVLLFSIFFLFVLPTVIRRSQHYFFNISADFDAIVNNYYHAYKSGSLKDVVAINYKTYPSEWINTWIEWRDMSETLGRFLLGYYILRRQLLINLDENILLIKKVWGYTFAVTVLYFVLVLLNDEKVISTPSFILYPFFKTGILFTTLFYATSLIQLYYKKRLSWLMQAFRNLGCMTLTNYLTETIVYVIIFYGIGFGLLGDFSFRIIWLCSFVVYFLQAIFSKWWLSKYNYGPVEWIWRQLTYRQRFQLRKRGRSVTGVIQI
jgi:uncharacterized protein